MPERLDQAVDHVWEAAIDQGTAAPELRHGGCHTGAEKRLEYRRRAQSALGDQPAPGIARPAITDEVCTEAACTITLGAVSSIIADCRALRRRRSVSCATTVTRGSENRGAGSGRDLAAIADARGCARP